MQIYLQKNSPKFEMRKCAFLHDKWHKMKEFREDKFINFKSLFSFYVSHIFTFPSVIINAGVVRCG